MLVLSLFIKIIIIIIIIIMLVLSLFIKIIIIIIIIIIITIIIIIIIIRCAYSARSDVRFKFPASEWFCLWLIKLKLNVFGGVIETKIYILSHLSIGMINLNILLDTHTYRFSQYSI